ncbi:OTU domain-containing protein [Wolbachia endosymbiont of Chironomus riparius]|uniref:hypothetical protein n=1 Tax=Wolbachia endosymbiont of Chironomus riparius TaxID=2883238 RepID=UPI00209F5FB8|nr:hypothetical protein [Wolbachia endosymbiont of Chironomus riparius]
MSKTTKASIMKRNHRSDNPMKRLKLRIKYDRNINFSFKEKDIQDYNNNSDREVNFYHSDYLRDITKNINKRAHEDDSYIEERESKRLKGDENKNSYPKVFYTGKAIGNGSCFFDSFRQSLEQQKGIKVTVEQLREDCKTFASKDPQQWFTYAIANSCDKDGNKRSETITLYTKEILNNDRWGDSYVEGRILCERYGVKLHVIEKQYYIDENEQTKSIWADELISYKDGSKSISEIDYNDDNVLHIINSGSAHFEPLLNKDKELIQIELLLNRDKELIQKDFELAKHMQVEEVLKFLKVEKTSPLKAEVKEVFNKLLAKNTSNEIKDVIDECVDYFEGKRASHLNYNMQEIDVPNPVEKKELPI